MRETDSTGHLYATTPIEMAIEAFEAFLHKHHLFPDDSALPIVHTECDLISPAMHGEEVTITLSLNKIGTTSFAISTEIYTDKLIAKTLIVHVFIKNNSPFLISDRLKTALLLIK